MKKRVLIVGAGPGGLAAAMLLAKAGLEVEVVERLPRVGGRTSTFEVEDFRFDLGPTFFLFPEILAEIYAACGYDLWSEVPMDRLDPQYRLAFGGGGMIDATPNVEAMERQIAAISPQDAGGFRRFLADNRVKLDQFRPILQSPFGSWASLLSPALLKLLPLVRPWRSLDQELGAYFRDPRIKLAFSFQSKYLGMSPFKCPSLFSILSFLEYEHGVYHPRGGCGAISTNMARLATEMGAKISLEDPVEELLFEGRKCVGARTKSGLKRADKVIINADFARAMEKLVPNHLRRKYTNQKLAQKRYSCSTFMLYLGIEGRYDALPHHTIYMSRDYVRNLDEIENRHVLSEDPSLYVQNASVTDPTLAPAGMSTMYVLAPVTQQHANVDWQRDAAAFRTRVIRQLEKVGIEDVERRIRVERMITPQDWDQSYEIYRGATFNLAHDLLQMLHLRPHNRFEEFENMYLTGGGTHPGSGLPVIYESARISSRLLLSDLGLPVEWLAPGAARRPQPVLAEAFGSLAAEHG